MAYVLAVLAGFSNAASNVLQRKANREEPPELSMSPRLILNLLHRPVWLAGFGTVVLSFLLMAAALSMGRLAAVQPIVVIELPLTLLGAAKIFHAELSRREWSSIIGMSLGLAGLVGFLSPGAGNKGEAPGLYWLLASVLTVVLIGVLIGVSRTGTPGRRAAFLGVATGLSFGLTAAFMKGMTVGFQHGITGVLTRWQTYAMAGAGLAGMFLMQNALHAGRLVVAQPGVTLADPAVAVLWGIFVFHERVQPGWHVVLAGTSALLMALAAVFLARSPLLEDKRAAHERSSDDAAPESRPAVLVRAG